MLNVENCRCEASQHIWVAPQNPLRINNVSCSNTALGIYCRSTSKSFAWLITFICRFQLERNWFLADICFFFGVTLHNTHWKRGRKPCALKMNIEYNSQRTCKQESSWVLRKEKWRRSGKGSCIKKSQIITERVFDISRNSKQNQKPEFQKIQKHSKNNLCFPEIRGTPRIFDCFMGRASNALKKQLFFRLSNCPYVQK